MRPVRALALAALAALAVLALGCPNPDNLRTTGGTGGPGGSGLPGGTGGAGGTTRPGDASDGTPGTGGSMGGATAGTGGTAGAAGTTGGTGTGGATGGMGGAAGGTGGVVVPRSQVCEQYANAVAQIELRCSRVAVELSYGTTENHRARLRLDCNLVDLPGVKWPVQPFAPCAAALANLPCADWHDQMVPAACVTGGEFGAGAACGAGAQCQTRFCGEVATNGCGRCGPRPALGAPCQGFCDDGLLCTANGTCARPGAAGAACNPAQPCRQSLACLGGTCQARLGLGAPCTAIDDCDLVNGIVCNTNQGVCVSFTTGNQCGVRQDGSVVACSGGAFCNGANGTCIPPAADGAACNQDAGPRCLPPAACNGTCQLPMPNRSCNTAAPALRRPPAWRRDPGSIRPDAFPFSR